MKYIFTSAILLFSISILAQQKQIPVAQPSQQSPQVNVIRYDTVVTHGTQHQNDEDMKIYSSTGRLVKGGKILNGKKEGIWRSYYENGTISRVEEYHEDVLNGIVLAIEADGSVTEEDNLTNGVKNGVSHQYNRNGTLKLEENYANGVLNGVRRVFSTDGKMSEEGFWKSGRRDSINRWAYPSGKIYVEYTYKNGNINGPSKLFYESGNVKASGNYSEGYEEGSWKEFSDSTKKVIAEGNYKGGKKTGVWKIYSPAGIPSKPEVYDAEGNLVGSSVNSKEKSKTK